LQPPPAGNNVEERSVIEPKTELKTELFEEISAEEAAPRMFRHLVGKGHSEFSTGRQQVNTLRKHLNNICFLNALYIYVYILCYA
jgi:hypothetical protein